MSLDTLLRKMAKNPGIGKAIDYLSSLKGQGEYKRSGKDRRGDAYTDTLTGLANRAYMEIASSEMLRKAIDEKKDYHFVLLDIDHFKRFNDCYSHAAGDEVLKNMAEVMVSAARTYKQSNPETEIEVARWGGEEFSCSVVGDAKGFADYLREKVEKSGSASHCRMHDGSSEKVTMTAGIGTFRPDGELRENGDPYRKTILTEVRSDADTALFFGKMEGRNQVQAYSPELEQANRERDTYKRWYLDMAGAIAAGSQKKWEDCIPEGMEVNLEKQLDEGSCRYQGDPPQRLRDYVDEGLRYIQSRGLLKDTRMIESEADASYRKAVLHSAIRFR